MKTQITKQTGPDNLPSRVIFEVTQICNYNCPDCLKGGHADELSAENIYAIGKKLVTAGVPSISWTGGEPYMVPNFLKIVQLVNEHNKTTVQSVNTNGSLINLAIARETAQVFDLARVTIYGINHSFYKNIGRIKGFTMETSITAIDNLINFGLPVQVNIPLFKIADATLILDYLEKRYGSKIAEAVLIPRIVGNGLSKAGLIFQKYQSSLESVNTYSFPVRVFKWQPGKHMVIKADGFAYAHPVPGNIHYALKIGNAQTDSIVDLWSNFPSNFINDHRSLTPDMTHLKKKY